MVIVEDSLPDYTAIQSWNDSTKKFVGIVLDKLSAGHFNYRQLRKAVGMGQDTAERFVCWMYSQRIVEPIPGGTDQCPLFRVVPQV